MEFIQSNQNRLSNHEDFYIGGTTNFPSKTQTFDFSDYLPDSSGKPGKIPQFRSWLCINRTGATCYQADSDSWCLKS